MDVVKDNRVSYYDNLRFFLITMVVIGHFIDVMSSQSNIFKGIYLFIYSFHMPLFLFLAGMFHNNKNILPKVMRFLMIGFVLNIWLFLLSSALNKPTTLSLFSISGIAWYMFVLAGYTLLSYLLRSMNKWFILVFFIILGLFSGYDASIGDMFVASRFIVFYPFFVLGEILSPNMVQGFVRRKWIRFFSILMLILWSVLCVFKLNSDILLRALFKGRSAFVNFTSGGGIYRGLCYIITLISGLGVMCLVPHRKLPVITRLGSRTMQIFFWHMSIRNILIYLKVDMFLSVSPAGKLIWILLSLVCTFILGFGIFGFPTSQIIKASNYAKSTSDSNSLPDNIA